MIVFFTQVLLNHTFVVNPATHVSHKVYQDAIRLNIDRMQVVGIKGSFCRIIRSNIYFLVCNV